jgi:ParB/RepB/Spo0J family partition protein
MTKTPEENASTMTALVSQQIPLELIDPDPTNRRDPPTPEEVAEMAATLASVGQLHDVKVRPGRKGRYRMVRGHLRALAAQSLGWTTIRGVIDETMSDEEAKKEQVVENLARKDPSIYQQALAFQDLLGLGMKAPAIAKLTGKAVGTIKNRLAILELPEAVARRVGRNGFSSKHARLLAPLSGHASVLEAVIVKMVDGIEEVATVDEFGREMAAFLVSQKLAVDPLHNFYEFGLPYQEVQRLVAECNPVKVKTGAKTFTLVLDVDTFKQKVTAAEKALVEARKADADPDAPSAGESKAEKKKRLAAEAEREAEREKREALRAKAAKLLGSGVAESAGKLDPAEQSWLTFWIAASGAHRGGGRAQAMLAVCLGLTSAKAERLLGVDFAQLWSEGGKVAVPKSWLEATDAQRSQATFGASVLAAIDWNGMDELLVKLTGLDEAGWQAEAEAPRKRRRDEEPPEGGEPMPDAAGRPALPIEA